MDLMLLIANLAAVVLLTNFIALYHYRAPWWSSPHGRSIVAMKLAVLLVAAGGLCRRLDRQDLADVVILIGWTAVAAVMAWRTCMLWHDTARRDRET